MIEISNLRKRYKTFELSIDDVRVEVGEKILLAGNNGAGKTTFLQLTLDLIRRDEGYILTKDGQDVSKSTHWKSFTNSYLGEEFLIDFLSPQEFTDFILEVYQRKLNVPLRGDLTRKIKEFFDFTKKDSLIRELSAGNKQKAGIVSALVTNPELLILDEPFANLDPTSRFQLADILNDLSSQEGTTIIVSSHDISDMVRISDRMILLEEGVVVRDEKVSDETLNELYSYFNILPEQLDH